MSGPYGWVVENIVPTNERIALAQLQREAALGDMDAQHHLGGVYAEGRLVPRDPKQAERWHLEAAGQGHRDSQSWLCASFLVDHGSPKKLADAVEWCERGYDQGDAEAAFRLANLYAKGIVSNRSRGGGTLRLRSSLVSTTPTTETFPSTWCKPTAG